MTTTNGPYSTVGDYVLTNHTGTLQIPNPHDYTIRLGEAATAPTPALTTGTALPELKEFLDAVAEEVELTEDEITQALEHDNPRPALMRITRHIMDNQRRRLALLRWVRDRLG